ncbi:MAG TPA: hypothetical protein VKT75_14420 [Acidobacteriaceae bacterium]|nr:hypothetical protein [Acidobacteriaceae bacterium]
MFSCLQQHLCWLVILLLVPEPGLYAQQTATIAAPVPPQVLNARAVFVSNGGGSNYFEIFSGGPDRGYNTLYMDLQRSQQYELVSSPSQADLIFEIRSIAPAARLGTDDVVPNPQLILNIRDPRTQAILWTTSANVRVFGTKKRRDRQFDACVAVLLDKVAQITGRPLSPAQTKAIDSNSRMPTAAKVFIVASIAAAAAMTTYGIYRVTHPPTLPMPTTTPFPAVP